MRLSEHPRFIPYAAAMIVVTGVGMVAAPSTRWKIGFVALSVLTVVVLMALSAVIAIGIRQNYKVVQAKNEATRRQIRALMNNHQTTTDPDAAA